MTRLGHAHDTDGPAHHRLGHTLVNDEGDVDLPGGRHRAHGTGSRALATLRPAEAAR